METKEKKVAEFIKMLDVIVSVSEAIINGFNMKDPSDKPKVELMQDARDVAAEIAENVKKMDPNDIDDDLLFDITKSKGLEFEDMLTKVCDRYSNDEEAAKKFFAGNSVVELLLRNRKRNIETLAKEMLEHSDQLTVPGMN